MTTLTAWISIPRVKRSEQTKFRQRPYKERSNNAQVGLDERPRHGGERTYLSKIVEYSVSMLLIHSSVDIKARVAKIGNFLGQKFDSLKI